MHQPRAHPLAALITEAAAGRYPAADGGWRRVPPWRPGLEGIVAFTGHAVLAGVSYPPSGGVDGREGDGAGDQPVRGPGEWLCPA
jgi:hypothetical protein